LLKPRRLKVGFTLEFKRLSQYSYKILMDITGVRMYIATLSEKFQIGIPKAFRTDLGLKAGQQFVFVAKGDAIIMIPRRELSEMRGQFKGANTKNVRDRSERT
jgi:AbrB family looped-hinge helix DNA binding protein